LYTYVQDYKVQIGLFTCVGKTDVGILLSTVDYK